MFAKRAFAKAALSSMILAALSSSAMSESSSSDLLSDPTVFYMAYGLSFANYDECGDSEAGRISRRAILERFEQCPFSPEARAKFHALRIELLENMVSQLLPALEQGKRLDPLRRGAFNPDGTPMTCADERRTARYIERRDLLLRYARGEVPVEQVISDSCDVEPGAL